MVLNKWLVSIVFRITIFFKFHLFAYLFSTISFIIAHIQRILHLDFRQTYLCSSHLAITTTKIQANGRNVSWFDYWRRKLMRALCVIMTMTSMMLNLLTKKSEDLLSSHISLFAFWRNKWKRSQSQFFLCFKCKNKFKTFKYQHQFLKILKNTYSMVTLIPDHQVKFSLFGGFYRNQISKLGPQKMVIHPKKF